VPLKSLAYNIWSRLYDRFNLEPRPVEQSEQPSVGTQIVPITDADELLTRREINQSQTAAFGIGIQPFVTVPAGQRWKVWAIRAVRASGDRDIDVIAVTDGSNSVRIRTFTATNDEASGMFNQPLQLDPGWSVQFEVTGGTTDSAYAVSVLLTREDAF